MLCLTRRFAKGDRPGEEIWIDGGRVKVVAVLRDCDNKAYLMVNGFCYVMPLGRCVNFRDFSITCLRIRKGDVRLGIEAPKHVAIDREEIHYAKHGTEWGINEQLPERESGGAGSGESDPRNAGSFCEAGAAI